jgi:aerobic carbon-monoxide dehydrogenase large subunit
MTDASAARYAGTRVHRVEDARLLTGTGTFIDDISRPGMLHACFVRSPIARARILRLDIADALALPGVHAVFIAADLNADVRAQWYTMAGPDAPDTPRPPLASDEVRFVGDPVALVVAENRYIAEDAVDLVNVEYEPLVSLANYADALDHPELVHDGYPRNIAAKLALAAPDALAEVFESAAHVVTGTIHQQAYAAVPMEPRGLVAEWSSGDLTIWAATQAPHEMRAFAGRLLGVDEHRVRVVMRDTGGGFGQKVIPQREDMCIILAARKVRGPLKWIEDRRENLMAGGHARREHGTVTLAFDDNGTFLAAQLDHVQDVGAYPTPAPGTAGFAVGFIFPGPYRIPRANFSTKLVFSNTCGRTAYRGPWQFESVAREVMLDIAARQMRLDPAELRRRNMLRRDELPCANPLGMPYSDISPTETFEQALAMLDYDGFRRLQTDARAAGRFLGVGTCTYVEPTAAGTGFYGTEGATIRIEPSGKVNVYVAGGSTGNSLETTAVQLAADALGVRLDDVATIQGDTAVTPFGAGTGGSRSGSMLAGAIGEVGGVLRSKLVALAAHQLEVAEEDIVISDSRASVRGTPTVGITLAEMAAIAYFQPAKLPPGMTAGLEASGRYTAKAPIIWANATHVCTCEVDPATGMVTLIRYIVSEDCGAMINPNVVEGQIAGGTVQGIGGALMEHLVWDDQGNPLTTTFLDYLIPTATDVPMIEYGHIETPSPGPGGYKGVGEGGAIGAPPAVINAVADALAPFGVTITHLPLSPNAIVALLAGRSAVSG